MTHGIEFFGSEIESINKFDITTGKKKENLRRIAVYPAKHFITSPATLESAVEEMKRELEEQLENFKRLNKPLEAERLRQRTTYDMEMLREMGYCSGIENYSRILVGRAPGSRPECLIDYFPPDMLDYRREPCDGTSDRGHVCRRQNAQTNAR
ncbi:MAG: hypothetical protein IPF57_18545 [Gammaproteobacteria bacterium]|nr:hypothetical protein [Gammaproteobacteria bacterium]